MPDHHDLAFVYQGIKKRLLFDNINIAIFDRDVNSARLSVAVGADAFYSLGVEESFECDVTVTRIKVIVEG